MSEMAINNTTLANNNSTLKGELDAHFESKIDAQKEAEVGEGFQYKNWLQRSYMTPSELHEYINDYRAHIAHEIEKAA